MIRKFLSAFILASIFVTPSAFAKVWIQMGWGCSGQYHSLSGYVPNFRSLKYTYDCDVSCCRGESTKPGTCEGDFNDKTYSVEITNNETVRLYQNFDFRGEMEEFSGNGCYDLRYLGGRVSSGIVYR